MLTLGTQRDLTNDMLIKGIIDSVVTVNQFYAILPFKGIQGNALAYNRELADFDQTSLVNAVNTGHTSINKDQQTFTRHSTELTTLIGDAQVNGLIQAVGSDYNDATAVQVAAKAKGLGRSYMNLLINGTTNSTVVYSNDDTPLFSEVLALLLGSNASLNNAAVVAGTLAADFTDVADTVVVPAVSGRTLDMSAAKSFLRIADAVTGVDGAATQTITLTANGASALNAAYLVVNGYVGFEGLDVFSGASVPTDIAGSTAGLATLSRLDVLIDRVHDKDGMVDYIMSNSAGVRKITSAFRTAGTGFDMMDVKTSSGAVMSVQSYRGVPIFRNDFIGSSTAQRASALGGDLGDLSGTAADIFVGTLDDGSLSHGICGLTATKSAGMQVQKLGAREEVDADITRVKWYCGLAHFSELGLVKGEI